MKSLRYLPIAFFAGVHGLLIFAPYAALVLATHLYLKRRPMVVPATAPAADRQLGALPG